MAFFDKLNDLAKSVKDAANDAVETTRIKSRISSEKRAVDEACRKIGEYYYAKRAGDMGPVDDDILEYCIEIDEHMRVISELEAELERFVNKTAKDKDAQAKAANKQAELNAQFAAEYDRVTARVMDELRKVVAQWIKTNKKGITVVVPAHTALGYAPAADVSGEILKKLNAVAIDFTAK